MDRYIPEQLAVLNMRGRFQPPRAEYPWIPDCGDGTYQNPIIFADYSDPDVIRVGEDFFMTASSFNCTPGLPILHSRDLVNWRLIGHALENLPGDRYRQVQHGCGVWAPSIRFHNGRFWIFFSTPDEGIFMVSAERVTGPWTEPHLVQAGKGLIDPCPFWDDDGRAYLVHAYAWSRARVRHRLRLCPMAPDGTALLGEGRVVFEMPLRHPVLEGPKLFKKDGWYYILAPAGGVPTGWQVALRSQHIYGPYEDRIVLEQGMTPINGPHQGALVDAPDGTWWFVHFQDCGVFGRVVHLQPAWWVDGWPMIGADWDGNGIGEPVLRWYKPVNCGGEPRIPQTNDEFDGWDLGPQWQWQANHSDEWFALGVRPGWLRLRTCFVPEAKLACTPNLLLQKFPAQLFVAETLMEFSPAADGDEAGLVVTGQGPAALVLRKERGRINVVFRTDGPEDVLQSGVDPLARFRVSVNDRGVCRFSYAVAPKLNRFVPVALPVLAQPGAWIGAKVGIFALARASGSTGFADFDYFRFSALA